MVLKTYTYKNSWNEKLDATLDSSSTLIMFFGASKESLVTEALRDVREVYPNSLVMGSSSAGEINMGELQEDSVVLSVMHFANTKIKLISEKIQSTEDSFSIGEKLATSLNAENLKNIFLLSDGLQINGSQLTKGINSQLGEDVVVSGGLAADGAAFEKTWIIVDGEICSGCVSAVGLYGEYIHVAHGFEGGWDKFGIERTVTKSSANVLYTLDDKPALDIYKNYLGEKAKELPASGLLFPLELKVENDEEQKTVRTILAVDEEEKSITFAGDIPEGSVVSLMKANHGRLIEGAFASSEKLDLDAYENEDVLCVAISCIGRKLVLKQMVEDELEAVLENLPSKAKQIGFYSYGEISPLSSGKCDLHNQTMTLTLIWESHAPST